MEKELNEEIEAMYRIIQEEHDRLERLKKYAKDKELWCDLIKYESMQVEIRHILDRFHKEITIA